VKPIKKKKVPRKDIEHYVDNGKFLEIMKEFVQSRQPIIQRIKSGEMHLVSELPKIPDEIGLIIYNIANKLSNSPKFSNYPFKDEMISDGIENCLQYIDNFNPDKSNNPFAYFTQIIYWAFVRRIKKEKQYLYVKYKSIENCLVESEVSDDPDIQSTVNQYGSEYADLNMRNYIEQFESTFKKSPKSKNGKSLLD
jgi:hypothetical protein